MKVDCGPGKIMVSKWSLKPDRKYNRRLIWGLSWIGCHVWGGGGLAEGNDRRVTNEQFPLSQISRDIYFGIDFRPV